MSERFEFKFKVDEELLAAAPAAVAAAGEVTAVVHAGAPDEGGYWAEAPLLPGCVSEGDTLAQLQANIREAAEGWLEVTRDRQRAALRRTSRGKATAAETAAAV